MIINFQPQINNNVHQKGYAKQNSIAFKGYCSNDIFIRNNNIDEIKEKKQALIQKRNLTDFEKWNIIGSIKEYRDHPNIDIRYNIKKDKFYEGMSTRFLDKVFAKNVVDEPFVVYRGTTLEDFGYSATNEETINDFFKKGKVVVSPTYLSTSIDKEHAKKFTKRTNTKLLLKINLEPNSRALFIDDLLTAHEKYMRNFKYNEENEVFVDRLAKIKMKDIYKEGDFTVIEADIAGHEDKEQYLKENNIKPY